MPNENFFSNEDIIKMAGGIPMTWKQEDKYICTCHKGKICQNCLDKEDEFYEEE